MSKDKGDMIEYYDIKEGQQCYCQEVYNTCNTTLSMKCAYNVIEVLFDYLRSHCWEESASKKVLKIRHNLFVDSFLSDNGIDIRETDYCLRNIGIDSDLTPDIYTGDNHFIEFFVSTNTAFALQNKIDKYSPIEGIVVDYVYYDVTEDKIESTLSGGFEMGVNLSRFSEFMRTRYHFMRYVRLDNLDIDCENITPGYNPPKINRLLRYERAVNDITFEEYNSQVYLIKDKLQILPDEGRYDLYFDCKTRRLSIDKGSKTYDKIERSIDRFNTARQIIIYKNFDLVETIDEDGFNLTNGDYNGIGNGHNFEVEEHRSYVACLRRPISAKKIYEELDKLEFNGLYSQRIDMQSSVEIASAFYDDWVKKCSAVQFPKIKRITMLPLPSPDDIRSDIPEGLRFKSKVSNYLMYSIIGRTNEFVKVALDPDEEKSIIENKKKLEDLTSTMNILRREWIKLEGSNSVSYKIYLYNQFIKDEIRNGDTRDPEAIASKISNKMNLSNETQKYYLRLMSKKALLLKVVRKSEKRKVSRSNLITLDKKLFAEMKLEKDLVNNTKNQDRGEESMGLYGYNGLITLEELTTMIDNFWDYMIQDSWDNNWFDMEISEYSFPDSTAGQDSLKFYIKLNQYYNKLKKTRIFNVIALLSNLCRSIWAISTYKTKTRQVVFDRIGTKSCVVFCNGTGTIQKYKSSKSFKVLLPVDPLISKFCGMDSRPNEELVEFNGKLYFMSHWMYMKTQHLKYFMELPMRWMQIMTIIQTEYGVAGINTDIAKFLTINMLNARRANETLLHDLKYLTFNLFGLRGCYKDLLSDKFIVPRDMWMRYIEERFIKGIPDYVSSINENHLMSVVSTISYNAYKIKHPLSKTSDTFDQFNLWVYSSYVYPKGVFTHFTEQIVNMRSILNIHNNAMQILDDCHDFDSVEQVTSVEIGRIFENDLFYNSRISSSVGVFAESELMASNRSVNMRAQWYKIINSDITEYANSHGLRSDDLSVSKSWGKKGHDIMTSFFAKIGDPNEIKKISEILPSENLIECRKNKHKVTLSKYTIIKKSKQQILERIELNNANKVQWGGSREIYILTFGAKNVQWALEQMFGYVAQMIDNELIHIPAANRLSLLYDSIKSKPRGLRYYLTLDCRKWAPLSNLNKYVAFINSMSGIFPAEFIQDFNYFFKLYYDKRLFFKKEDVDSFLKPDSNKQFTEYFHKSGDNYYIRMPYSFMMGMFNYLSSIYHAFCQRYFIKNILPLISKKWDCDITMKMFAHSDDSGGYIEIDKTTEYVRVLDDVLRMYEAFQKCNNHMLSLKKCTVSPSYFEITSYCFIKTDPMPVLSKFIYNHQINLTPSGLISDIKSLSSDVTEMVMNGSSFEAAFIKYIYLGNSYRKFCLGECLKDIDSRTSKDLLGFPLIHPYYLIIYRSDSEAKWFNEFGADCYGINYHLLDEAGLTGPWGEKRGLAVHMVTMKNRNSDDRFVKFVDDVECPDDIIPTNHYICYMKKMASKYFRDTMWYSLHDIDGTIIQSNMFNKGLCQTYDVFGRSLTLNSLLTLVRSIINFDEHYVNWEPMAYVQQIDKTISYNKHINYNASYERPKPSTIDTYYNSWWKRSRGELKSVALCKMCGWMVYLIEESYNIPDIMNAAKEARIEDIIARISEEEPLTRITLLTRSRQRFMDRFDHISSWYFKNNYPYMTPGRIKGEDNIISFSDGVLHPECVASAIFEVSTTNDSDTVNNMTVEITSEAEGVVSMNAIKWLRSGVISDNPIVRTIISYNKTDWLNTINFIALKHNQAQVMGRYWLGNTLAYCRVSGRMYELIVRNGKIVNIKCQDKFAIHSVRRDMEILIKYGFSYDFHVSHYKPKKMWRVTIDTNGIWSWSNSGVGMQYYDNITLDPDIGIGWELDFIQANRSRFDEDVTTLGWFKRSMQLKIGKIGKFKAYVIHEKPCISCLERIKIRGRDISGTTPKAVCNRTQSELINNLRSTYLYNSIYSFLNKYSEIISEDSKYMCSPGSLLSCIYKGDYDQNAVNYLLDYKNELVLNSASRNRVDKRTIVKIQNQINKIVKFNLVNEKVVITCDNEILESIINEDGLSNLCTAMVLMPVERSRDYYKLFTYEEYWVNNTNSFPDFIKDTICYIDSTIHLQDGYKKDKVQRLKLICDRLNYYSNTVFNYYKKQKFTGDEIYDFTLFSLLSTFKDVGQSEDPEVSSNFYYDPLSIMGALMKFMIHMYIYSIRIKGKLIDNHTKVIRANKIHFERKLGDLTSNRLGYTLKKLKTSTTIMNLPLYDFDVEQEMCYPIKGCKAYQYSQDEDEFDDEVLTYDMEESMESFNFDKKDYCDAGNVAIYYSDGEESQCCIMPNAVVSMWEPTDNPYIIKRAFKSRTQQIRTKNGFFIRSEAITEISGVPFDQVLKKITGADKTRVIDHIAAQLSDEGRELVKEMIKDSGKKDNVLLVDNKSLFGLMKKALILDQLAGEKRDLTQLMEGEEACKRIMDETVELKVSNLDQRCLAELEVLAPDIASQMIHNNFRLTDAVYEECKMSSRLVKFKSRAALTLFQTVLRSIITQESPDNITENSLIAIIKFRNLLAEPNYLDNSQGLETPDNPNPNSIEIRYL